MSIDTLIKIQATDKDWEDSMDLTKGYFEFLNESYAKEGTVLAPESWSELKEAYLEHKMYQDMFLYYKKLLMDGKVDQALDFSNKVLFRLDLSREEAKKFYDTISS